MNKTKQNKKQNATKQNRVWSIPFSCLEELGTFASFSLPKFNVCFAWNVIAVLWLTCTCFLSPNNLPWIYSLTWCRHTKPCLLPIFPPRDPLTCLGSLWKIHSSAQENCFISRVFRFLCAHVPVWQHYCLSLGCVARDLLKDDMRALIPFLLVKLR